MYLNFSEFIPLFPDQPLKKLLFSGHKNFVLAANYLCLTPTLE